MGAKVVDIQLEKESIMNDMTDKENQPVIEQTEAVDEDKLAKLKARLAEKAKANEMKPMKKDKSLIIGIVGSGQAGSRIAEAFYRLGYDSVCVNTAMQDLKFIELPESNKLLLEYGGGGAAKEISIGHQAAETHKEKIAELVNNQLHDAQMLIFATSLGGGSGAGSVDTMVDVLATTGKPLAVITVLPMDSDDAQTKNNALNTLAKLAKYTQSKKINNLIVVDNAKLDSLYSDVGQMDFFRVANEAIVRPIDVFNTLSSQPSSVKSLDPMELSKMLIDGEGLTVYGELTVENFQEDTAIAEAIVSNLDGNLLASGFDLKKSKYVGVMIVANKEVWAKIPSSSVNYAVAMVNDVCGSPVGVFKGLYTVEMPESVVKVYSMFSGLALPETRVEQLKKDAKELMQKVKAKDEVRNLSLKIDTGTEDSVSAAQKVKEKIAQKTSSFGKFVSNNVVDRRK